MRVEKFTDPTRFDSHAQGTLWRVPETERQFIQINENPNKPEWRRVDDILGRIAYHCNASDRVIRKILDLYSKY